MGDPLAKRIGRGPRKAKTKRRCARDRRWCREQDPTSPFCSGPRRVVGIRGAGFPQDDQRFYRLHSALIVPTPPTKLTSSTVEAGDMRTTLQIGNGATRAETHHSALLAVAC